MKVIVKVGDISFDPTLSTESQTMYSFEPKMWLRHPNYNLGTKANDIALIYCPINTYRSNNVDIAYLYLQDSTDTGVFVGSYLNQIVEVVGWGEKQSLEL